jgi:hypothetical protein
MFGVSELSRAMIGLIKLTLGDFRVFYSLSHNTPEKRERDLLRSLTYFNLVLPPRHERLAHPSNSNL